MIIGNNDYHVVSGGDFKLDGGAMFGIVPKTLWEKVRTPDGDNRIDMATNCLLVRTPQYLILIDTGYGTKMSDKERAIYRMSDHTVTASLATQGVRPEDIDIVILSHLHFDHAGGATVADLVGQMYPTFPRARYFVQQGEWDDAVNGFATMTASYLEENYKPLMDAGMLTLVDGDREICDGVRVAITGGHTRHHQLVIIASGGETVVYAGDIIPTHSHIKGPYSMAYDLFPYDTMLQKLQLLEQASARGWIIVLDHDPLVTAGRIVEEKPGRYGVEAVDLR
ncbi:MAG: MBL fold metallo-hydrolase [Gemmatimonadota bacterium]|nr:MBL fold metallo-hydrolase [Gemmatimonadota bacterium]